MQTVSADINSAGLDGFSGGGWTGPGPKLKPAGIVHANEFVTISERVREPGALAFLSMFNRIGMRALKGYATGGLVSDIALPRFSGGAMVGRPSIEASRNLTLVLDGQRFAASAGNDTIERLTTFASREALRKGGNCDYPQDRHLRASRIL